MMTIGFFPLFGYCESCCSEHSVVFVGYMFSILLGIYLEMELLGPMHLYSFQWNNETMIHLFLHRKQPQSFRASHNSNYLLSLTAAVGPEFGSNLNRRIWVQVFHEVAGRCWSMWKSSEGLAGTGGAISRMARSQLAR